MTALSQSDRRLLEYGNLMLIAYRKFSESQHRSMDSWLAEGGKFRQWPGWEDLLGANPFVEKKKLQANLIEIQERKSA